MKTICAWLESASVRTTLKGTRKVLPQNMKALRADERVRFSGLPRTEAGL
ncbi:MAG: hypothetical protein Q8L64_02595 [bacterium]|nr:hypothetical protein [bacterium]